MKNMFQSSVTFAAIAFLIFFVSCGPKERTFKIPESDSVTYLTVGWYVPAEAVSLLVGQNAKPLIVKDGKTLMTLVISVGKKYSVDGKTSDSLKMANLYIATETPATYHNEGAARLDESFVCPMAIFDQSALANSIFKEFGFKTSNAQINLSVNQKGERHNFHATIKNEVGTIIIRGFFIEAPENVQTLKAIFNTRDKSRAYYFGNESSMRFSNGRGNIKNEGNTLISAMQMDNYPFILQLDKNATWDFEFKAQ